MTDKLIKLSSVVSDLKKTVSVPAYLREFKAAVKGGDLAAVELAEHFRLSATKGAKGERKPRETPDYALRDDEVFRHWHEATVARLSIKNGRSSRGVPLAALEAGEINFEEAAERTRQRLLSAQEAAARSRARKRETGESVTQVPSPYSPATE